MCTVVRVAQSFRVDLCHSNFACSIVSQMSCITQDIKKFDAKIFCFKKTAFSPLKNIWHYRIFLHSLCCL